MLKKAFQRHACILTETHAEAYTGSFLFLVKHMPQLLRCFQSTWSTLLYVFFHWRVSEAFTFFCLLLLQFVKTSLLYYFLYYFVIISPFFFFVCWLLCWFSLNSVIFFIFSSLKIFIKMMRHIFIHVNNIYKFKHKYK